RLLVRTGLLLRTAIGGLTPGSHALDEGAEARRAAELGAVERPDRHRLRAPVAEDVAEATGLEVFGDEPLGQERHPGALEGELSHREGRVRPDRAAHADGSRLRTALE